MNLADNKYEAMIKSYLAGQCSAGEALELLSWVAESEENRIYFKTAKEADEVWKLTDFEMPELDDAAVELALDSVNAKIDALEEEGTKVVQMPWVRRNYKYVSGIAAAVIVALFLGFLVMKPVNSTITLASNDYDVEIPCMLPDGTSLTFDGEGEASYSKHFAKSDRVVDFRGAAYFDVVKDETKPFIIHCDKMDVEVLGTSFLLNTNNPDKYFVDLYSGKVKMTAYDEKGNQVSTVVIMPGERGVYYLPQGELKTMAYREVKAEELKTDRVLDFNNVVLSTIVETLEYVYEVDIDLNEAYASEKLTARFSDQETIDEVLETIAAVFDFTVSLQDGVYMIR